MLPPGWDPAERGALQIQQFTLAAKLALKPQEQAQTFWPDPAPAPPPLPEPLPLPAPCHPFRVFPCPHWGCAHCCPSNGGPLTPLTFVIAANILAAHSGVLSVMGDRRAIGLTTPSLLLPLPLPRSKPNRLREVPSAKPRNRSPQRRSVEGIDT